MRVGPVVVRAVTVALGSRPWSGQLEDFIVVELGLEVVAVAEEVEQLEGGFVRLGDTSLQVFVKQLVEEVMSAGWA